MIIENDLEREYLQEFAYIAAEKEMQEMQELEEEMKQKPAKVVLKKDNFLNYEPIYNPIPFKKSTEERI